MTREEVLASVAGASAIAVDALMLKKQTREVGWKRVKRHLEGYVMARLQHKVKSLPPLFELQQLLMRSYPPVMHLDASFC